MARRNKMFAEDVETATAIGIAEPETNLAPKLDEAPKSDMIGKADELVQYIEEVEELRKYKELYLKLQKEYDELLEKLSELTYKNALLEDQKTDNAKYVLTTANNKFDSTSNIKTEQYHRKVNYINKSVNYKNNGYKDWN